MNYTRFQKILSSFVLFFFLFSITFRVPFFDFFSNKVFAEKNNFYNLVSILVEEDIYSSIQSELRRYANDIQGVMENTRIVILPIPSDSKAFNIASINESLYFDGYKGLEDVDFESKLIGTVLVGEFPLPIVYKGEKSSKTIVPYVDFEDKSYVYNHETSRYEENSGLKGAFGAEIWHGVISPSTGENTTDISAIKDYFDKNHDFYVGEGNFSNSKGIVNANGNSEDYEPYVFYYDQFREAESINYQNYKGYQAFQENMEDISYNRFSKELAQKIQEFVLGEQDEETQNLLNKIAPEFDLGDSGSTGPDLEKTFDTQTMMVTKEIIKKFIEIFNSATLGEFRKNVYNTGRYNARGAQVNADFIPFFISSLDEISSKIIKDVNTDLEKEIDYLVKNGLSRKIPVLARVQEYKQEKDLGCATGKSYEKYNETGNYNSSGALTSTNSFSTFECLEGIRYLSRKYENIFYGKKALDISGANECSIYRGSIVNGGQLVESTRGINVNNTQGDVELLTNEDQSRFDAYKSIYGSTHAANNAYICLSSDVSSIKTIGRFGGASPLNLDMDGAGEGELKLNSSNYLSSIKPAFDIKGSFEIDNSSKIPSPNNCLDERLMLTSRYDIGTNAYDTDDYGTYTKNFVEHNYEVPIDGVFKPILNDTCGANVSWGITNFTWGGWGASCPSNYAEGNGNCGSYSFCGKTKNEWNCGVTNQLKNYSSYNFDKVYKGGAGFYYKENCSWGENNPKCTFFTTLNRTYNTPASFYLDGSSYSPSRTITYNIGTKVKVEYKKIPSYFEHKSPTTDELTKQVQHGMTPNLPIDKNRYIDFIGAKGNYAKIDYPYLYRLGVESSEEVNIGNIKGVLKTYLDTKSSYINGIINASNPNTLTGKDLEIYNHLKTGTYPNANIDLYNLLINKPTTTFELDGETKTISYFDALAFSLYWNNLTSVGAKYKFVFENYLSDQFGDNDFNFNLPKNKKSYEIAYLGAPGDSQNMYVKIDPEGKGENPYADIISQNINLNTQLLGANIGGGNTTTSADSGQEGLFKCAPPEGVPIMEWFDAITCRLEEMMPPKISLSAGSCGGAEDLFSEEDLQDEEDGEGSDSSGGSCEDVNNNGIYDCLENSLSQGSLGLYSDTNKYFYNTPGKITANIQDKNGDILTFDNTTNVKFELVKVEVAKDSSKDISEINIEEIYNIDNHSFDTRKLAENYISFQNTQVRVNSGEAKTIFNTKGKDANVYLKANINIEDKDGNSEIFLESDELFIQIRGERLFISSSVLDNGELNSNKSTLKVSEGSNIFLIDSEKVNLSDIKNSIDNSSSSNQKLILDLSNFSKGGNIIPVSYPLTVTLSRGENNINQQIVNESDINSFLSLYNLTDSGTYNVEIIDASGLKVNKVIDLLPEAPSKIDLKIGSSIVEAGGSMMTNLISILDQFDNPVSGELYNINLFIDGKGLIFEQNSLEEINLQTFEGYKAFILKSTNIIGSNILKVSIKDSGENEVLFMKSEVIDVIEGINLEVIPPANLQVGENDYEIEVRLKDSSGNLMNNFNSRVYFTIDNIYLEQENNYTEIESGIGKIKVKTKTLAGESIPVEFQVEGINKIFKEELQINPGDPMKLELLLSSSKIEASESSYALLKTEIKDRYNNLVFNDNSTNVSLSLDALYQGVITIPETSKTVSSGKAEFKIYGTNMPGVAYFKASASPSFGSFTIPGDPDLTISGVSENAGKIETFYFWNDNSIFDKKYNAIYTTLIGAPYGDITQKGYLAGSLLFNKENRSLAITSLLNNPYKVNDVLSLKKAGNIKTIYGSSDLTQDISKKVSYTSDNKVFLNLYNESLNTFIGELYYNFDDDTLLNSCAGYGYNLDDCNIDTTTSSITLRSSNDSYSSYTESGNLIFENISKTSKIIIKNDGSIEREGNLYLELDNENEKDYVIFNIKNQNTIVGKIGFNFIGSTINITRDQTLIGYKLDNLKNDIIVYLPSSSYASRELIDNGDSKNIYYIDPFASDYELDIFSNENSFGYENFVKEKGLGWEKGNKTLLSFAAGKNVGEATKDYQSFSLINLGDPVLAFKKIKKKFTNPDADKKFDSTIGKLLTKDKDVAGYQIFDYDSNDKQDILLIKQDKYFKLLENTHSKEKFLDEGNIAYIVDLGNKDLVKTGDFTGDGYDDIFFVDNKGVPNILNNHNKDFVRISLEENFALTSKIVSAEKFDMDNDGKSDIVTLDEDGVINIFYGGGSPESPNFTKLFVGSGNGITLSSEPRNIGSLLYYEGLPQLSDAIPVPVSEEDTGVDEGVINSFLFEEVEYNTFDYNSIPKEITIENIGDVIPTENTNEKLTFLKGEYSVSSSLEMEKRMIDRNAGTLKSDDIVDVEIVLNNTTNNYLNDIKILDTIPQIFKFDISTVKVENDAGKIEPGLGNYELLIDGLELGPNESIKITYELITLPLKYGVITVGYFEDGEGGDDDYGDILLKENKENCSKEELIYRSTAVRTYLKGIKEPVCDPEKLKLPEELEENKVDENDNGLPDYMEDMLENQEPYDYDFAEDTDGDGIPDMLDDNPNYNSEGTSLMDDLASINENTDLYLEGLDNLIEGFSCGFGGGSCIATPMNWAPLAPGGDPTLFGMPIGDGLKVGEGLPTFSALTGMPMMCGTVPCCIPSVWPATPLTFQPGPTCGGPGAGGTLGTSSPTNFFRFFATPTLTGGAGIAACFGGPAAASGIVPPMGAYPIASGGNCIVAAAPLSSCSDDGSDGDPTSLGPISSGGASGLGSGGQFGVISGTCTQNEKAPSPTDQSLDPNSVEGYLDMLENGTSDSGTLDGIKQSFEDVFATTGAGHSVDYNLPNGPLISGFGGEGDDEFAVSVDFGSMGDGSFEDVINIKQTRIAGFPDFLMDWVTRQIEEIVVKLTDFPTLFIILPDFGSIIKEDWIDHNDDVQRIAQENNREGNTGPEKQISGIKQAYEFIANIPFVNLELEPVNITVPVIDPAYAERNKKAWALTAVQWEQEIQDKTNSWSFGATCEDEKCREEKAASEKIIVDANMLLGSLQKNIEVLESYKELPERLNKLISIKEVRLEQIICNIESIVELTTGWITKNGKRFKAWVELFVLIKAILKSWQLLIDVFVDYSAECSECKNSRSDLMHFMWKLISFVIPQIPVIEFPKWPDIILDLHNVRLGLNIVMPEFEFIKKPILLPTPPNLYLPDVPNVNIILPKLPILPELILPELPELPSLPQLELPDLPPPPTLPPLFASIEGVLDILKLVTKIMCIIKTSPFVPEWRAGDQIAFLTERSGYLSLDFIDVTLPQFSYSFVDAIAVTTYVNLELETDFIVELARNVLAPVNAFSNNITKIFDISIPDLDFSGVIPSDINIDVDNAGDADISSQKHDKQKEKLSLFAVLIAEKFNRLVNYIRENKDIRVSNRDFISLVNESLSSKIVTSDQRMEKVIGLWKEVQNKTYSEEDKFIEELKENNFAKFETLKEIITEEILETKELKNNIDNLNNNNFIKEVSASQDSDIKVYNERLRKYNDKFIGSTLSLITQKDSYEKKELQKEGNKLLSRVNSGLEDFSNNLLSSTTTASSGESANACIAANQSDYKYEYEGIYIVEEVAGENKSYRLFDYLEEIKGDEEFNVFALDGDNDDDLIYSVGQEIFIKENLEEDGNKIFLDLPPLFLSSGDNKFINGDTFYNSVNNAAEVNITASSINLGFSHIKGSDINNYRLEYYPIVDKAWNTKNDNYTPVNIRKTIVDSFAGIENSIFDRENEKYTINNNLGYIYNIGNVYSDLELKTKRLVNIRDDLDNGNAINLSPKTKLYAGNSGFSISYIGDNSETSGAYVGANSNIEFKNNVQIISITGDAYITGNEILLKGDEIREYLGKPIFAGTYLNIPFSEQFNESHHIEIKYYDNSKALLDFRKVEKYEVYDLGSVAEDYLIRLSTPNDYFYAKIKGFLGDIYGTSSQQILLSPQIEADKNPPELLSSEPIRIPVYQTKNIDLTDKLYEDSGVRNIKDIYIDFDLNTDSNGDGNPKNDRDEDKINITKTLISVKVDFGPYDTLFKKNIGVTLIDENGNVGYNELPFEVYSPTPQITSFSSGVVDGFLDEQLTEEPIDLYRFRGGLVTKISGKELTTAGLYNFNLSETPEGLTLTNAGSEVAIINEKTGKIDLKDFLSEIKVLSSNNNLNTGKYPKISIYKGAEEIYYEHISIGSNTNLEIVDTFADIEENGIYMRFTDKTNYNYYKIPSDAQYNPGVLGIYRSGSQTKEALFIIYPDGMIDVINVENFILEYSSFNEYVVIKLIDNTFEREVGQVIYKVDSSYIMK